MNERGARGPGLSLVGYRGSGKTSVGSLVAECADCAFFDLDALVEAKAGMRVAEVFEHLGERAFRDMEAAALDQVVREHPGSVVATGGGAIERPENQEALQGHGLVVWLETSAATIAERLGRDPGGRPTLTGRGLIAEVDEMLLRRNPVYRSVSDLVISTDGRSPRALAREIALAWAQWRVSD